MTRAKDELYLIKPNLDDPGSYYPMGGMSFSQLTRFITPEQLEAYFDTWSLGVGQSVGPDDSIDPFFDDSPQKYSL